MRASNNVRDLHVLLVCVLHRIVECEAEADRVRCFELANGDFCMGVSMCVRVRVSETSPHLFDVYALTIGLFVVVSRGVLVRAVRHRLGQVTVIVTAHLVCECVYVCVFLCVCEHMCVCLEVEHYGLVGVILVCVCACVVVRAL